MRNASLFDAAIASFSSPAMFWGSACSFKGNQTRHAAVLRQDPQKKHTKSMEQRACSGCARTDCDFGRHNLAVLDNLRDNVPVRRAALHVRAQQVAGAEVDHAEVAHQVGALRAFARAGASKDEKHLQGIALMLLCGPAARMGAVPRLWMRRDGAGWRGLLRGSIKKLKSTKAKLIVIGIGNRPRIAARGIMQSGLPERPRAPPRAAAGAHQSGRSHVCETREAPTRRRSSEALRCSAAAGSLRRGSGSGGPQFWRHVQNMKPRLQRQIK